MAIEEVTDTEVVQRCAACARENRVALSELAVGVARDGEVDARVVPLPSCSTCGSTELLIRSPDDEPAHPAPGSFGHLHRLLVDHVHAELVTRGRVIRELAADSGAPRGLSRPLPRDERARWFAEGLRLAARSGEGTSNAEDER